MRIPKTVNSKLDWNDNLAGMAAIFEAKLTLKDPQLQFSSVVFIDRFNTILWECT